MSEFNDGGTLCQFAGCTQVYTDPRILPCEHRTCAAHIEAMRPKSDDHDDDDDIKNESNAIECHFCGQIHNLPAQGFPVDENIARIIETKRRSAYEAAKKSYEEVTELLEKLINRTNEDYVNDYFEQAEADVLAEKEASIQKMIDDYQARLAEVQEQKANNPTVNKFMERQL